jgi:hypothetical protein
MKLKDLLPSKEKFGESLDSQQATGAATVVAGSVVVVAISLLKVILGRDGETVEVNLPEAE